MSRLPLYASRLSRPPRELQRTHILVRAAGHIYTQRAAGRIYTPRAAGHICTCHIESDWGFCRSCAEYSCQHNCVCLSLSLSVCGSLSLARAFYCSLSLSRARSFYSTRARVLSLSLSLFEALVGTAKIAAGHLWTIMRPLDIWQYEAIRYIVVRTRAVV